MRRKEAVSMSDCMIEQVCRFRTKREGYSICAKSKGITKENEEHIEDELNDSMNPLFRGHIGKSVMSCTAVEQDVLLALSTLQTDAFGRPAIFSNAYILPRAFYEDNMRRNPGNILYAQTRPSLTHQPGNPMLPEVEFDLATDVPVLDDVRKKYALSNERYAELLWAGSLALTDESVLCLKTKSSQIDEMAIIRDICYCIASGLPASLRKNISYSSAGDTHKKICLSSPQSGMLNGDCIEFDLDEETANDEMNELERLTYQALASADTETRAHLLQEMEEWTTRFLAESGINTESLLVVAYCCSQKVPLNAEQQRRLLYLLLASLDEKKNSGAIDMVAAELLEKMDEFPAESSKMLLERVVQTDNEILLKEICRLIANSTPEVQSENLAKAVEGAFGSKSERIFDELTDRIPVESEIHTAETKNKEIAYILLHRMAEKKHYACALMKQQSAENRMMWVNRILSQKRKAYEPLDWELLRAAVEKADADDHKLHLTEEAQIVWKRLMTEGSVPEDILDRVNFCVLLAKSKVPEEAEKTVQQLLNPEDGSAEYQKALCQTIAKHRDKLPTLYAKLVIAAEKCTSAAEWMQYLQTIEDEWLLQNGQEDLKKRTLGYYKTLNCERADECLSCLYHQGAELRKTKLPLELQEDIMKAEGEWSMQRLSIEQLMQNVLETEGTNQKVTWWTILDVLGLKSNPKARFIDACHALAEEKNDEKLDQLLSEKTGGITRTEIEEFRMQILKHLPRLYAKKKVFTWKMLFWYCFLPEGTARPHAAYEFMSSKELMAVAEQGGCDPDKILKECPEWVTADMRQSLGKELKKDAGLRPEKMTKLVEQVLCRKKCEEKDQHKKKTAGEVPPVIPAQNGSKHASDDVGALEKLEGLLKKILKK